MKKIFTLFLLALPLLGTAQQKEVYVKAEGVVFKMILVEGGTFTMGGTPEQVDAQDHERPTHKVTLSTYYIGETEVTQELWNAIMGDNPSHFSPAKSYAQCSYEHFVADANRLNEAFHGMVRIPTRAEWDAVMSPGRSMLQPVEWVSWDDCQEFCRRLSLITGKTFRLPTSAEWEYAARGGNKSKGYIYSGSNNADEVAWYKDNAYDVGESSPDYGTHPVKSKKPNELGLYDMSGNVQEWCSDWWGDYTAEAETNPQGPATGEWKVLRGGHWGHYSYEGRVSNRTNNHVGGKNDVTGLRVVMVQ